MRDRCVWASLSLVSPCFHRGDDEQGYGGIACLRPTDLMSPSSYSSILFRELAGIISTSAKNPAVVLNISNPGFCRSNIMREATGLWLLFIEGLKIVLSRTTEVGNRTLVAGAEGGLETHRQYLNDCHPDT